MDAVTVIKALGLAPHPEGGHFRETFRDPESDSSGRSRSTAIHYLLQAHERSNWHRVDASEVWHYHAGAPLELFTSDDGATWRSQVLGPDVGHGAQPQIVVPKNVWQAARSLGAWTLAGCTVAPAFAFSGFELATGDSPLNRLWQTTP